MAFASEEALSFAKTPSGGDFSNPDHCESQTFCDTNRRRMKIIGLLREQLVGARGFEPRTSCAQGRRATRLRYAPT